MLMKSNSGSVRRIRVLWKEGEFKILKSIYISRMTLPSSQPLPKLEEDQQIMGFWFEVNDTSGNLLYRRLMHDPLLQRVEIANEDGTFTNIPTSPREVIFEILIPENKENATLSLYRFERGVKMKTIAGQKFAEFDLKKFYQKEGEME